MQQTIDDTAVAAGGETVIHLMDITPAGSDAILRALPEGHAAHLAYDSETGTLEIMAPYAEHESDARIIDLLLGAIASDCNVEIDAYGSTTLQRKEPWAEPDSCFYIGDHARAIRGKKKLDLEVDPPPDIVVEIDISRARFDKRPLYARIGPPEFWRYDGKSLTFYELHAGKYVETPTSRAFRWLASSDVQRFIEMAAIKGQTATVRAWREWLRETMSRRPK